MSFAPYFSAHPTSDDRWRKLQGAHLFITGGSGLFGRWFLSALLEANARLNTRIQVTVLSRYPLSLITEFGTAIASGQLHVLQGDVTTFKCPPGAFTHMMHMATTSAQETYDGEDSLAKFHLLIQGTERVMQLAAERGVEKVLFTSSGVVYGAGAQGAIAESHSGGPDSTSAISGLAQGKCAAEFISSYYADKYAFKLAIARCFSFAGPGLPLDIHYAIGNFIRDALHAEYITVKGDGSPMRSFLYLGDLVHWLLALLAEEQTPRVCNVGSDQAVSILTLAHAVQNILAPHKAVHVLGDGQHVVGNSHRNWYVPDISLARQALQLEAWTPLETAIRYSADYLRAISA